MRRALAAVLATAFLAWTAPAAAILRSDVIADAQSWVDAGVPYSQGVWGSYCSWDYCYEDPLRGGGCYRPDCSGFVSATWGLSAPGNNTWGICDGTFAHEIGWDELQPGDALIKCSQHVMLFSRWVDGDRLEAYEEYTCGATAELRSHSASSLQDSGYIAMRYDDIEDDPPPNTPPSGSLDSADCTVTGWAQDPDAPDTALSVHLYIGGPADDPNAVGFDLGAANGQRADLCDAIGSCNHGFGFEVPPSFHDGAPHPVYAYSFDAAEGFPVLLPGSPASGTCDRLTPPIAPFDGVKRWVTSPTAFDAWRWSGLDVAPLDEAAVAEYPDGPNMPDAPVALQADDGTPDVWVLDGVVRRRVIDGASLAAWHLDGNVEIRPAAEVYEHEVGLEWPAEPFVFRGNGPETYVVDYAEPDDGDGAAGGRGDGADEDDALYSDPRSPGFAGGSGGDPTGGLSAAGCAVAPGASSAEPWAVLVLLAGILRRRRAR